MGVMPAAAGSRESVGAPAPPLRGSLELREVSKHYGSVRAADRLNLTVAGGEFVTLLGPSGSGKTTTLQIVAGFVEPSSGQVLVDGEPVTAPPHKRDIGMVFQNYALFPHMTAARNVEYPLMVRRVEKAERRRRVSEALEMVGLGDRGGQHPRQLSGGQQQRIALARALVFRPRIVLLDEPLGALDRKLREHLQLEIKRIQQDTGITMVYVTHDQEEALVMSDRIAVFNEGAIEQVGTPEEVYEHPASLFVAEFVSGPLSLAVPSDAPHGNASLLVRPERLRVLAGAPLADAGVNSLDARVEEIVYVGNERRYTLVASDGRRLVARQQVGAETDAGGPGEPVVVQWRVDDGVLIPGAEAT
jgi:putative spermidine/putrescine transport system ATP-binding protein